MDSFEFGCRVSPGSSQALAVSTPWSVEFNKETLEKYPAVTMRKGWLGGSIDYIYLSTIYD